MEPENRNTETIEQETFEQNTQADTSQDTEGRGPYPYANNEHAEAGGSNGSFYAGLIVGLAAMTVLVAVVFGITRFATRGQSTVTTNIPTQESAGSGAEGPVLDQETMDKIELISGTIDRVYYNTEDIDIEKQRVGLYSGLIESLGDPYSDYYTQEDFERLIEQTEGVYFGIGAYISMDTNRGLPYISGVIANSPAEESGIRENDYIIMVDGTDTTGMQTDMVATLVRGPEGTTVHLTLRREKESEDLEFDVTRRQILTPTVSHEMLESDIGFLRISEFDDVTYTQFTDAMKDLRDQGMKALLLDLRSNPGGNLDSVCEIARELLPKGEIVYTIDRNGERTDYTCDGKKRIDIPLAVLINGNSASASEILAGAIKDYEVGTLIGTKSFGKGVVQRIVTYNDGTAVKLTVSSFYSPKGTNINGVGIEPDIKVELDYEAYEKDGADNQRERAITELKKQIAD